MNISLFFSCIIYLILFKYIISASYTYLYEFGSVEVDGSKTTFIIFDSSTFSNSDTIHFQFTSLASCFNYIGYQFEDTIDSYNPSKYEDYLDHYAEPTNILYEMKDNQNYTVSYFNIRKSDYYLHNLSGKYLILSFRCDAQVTIKNNMFDHSSSGLSDGSYIAIIVCCSIAVIAAVILIICFCKRKKKSGPTMGYTNNGIMYPMPMPDFQQQQAPEGNNFTPSGQTPNSINTLVNNNTPKIKINTNIEIPSKRRKSMAILPSTSATSTINGKRFSIMKQGKRRKSIKK